MKGFSPSKPNANRNLPSSGSAENNENDIYGDNFANYKITHGRSFISGVPRKKILAQIKEIPSASDAQPHKNSNLDSGKSTPRKGLNDSSVKVYDPLTNYLSPRPQYLRFNPNRRREIFKRLEKELNTSPESKEASDEEDSPLLPQEGSDVIQRTEEICEEDNGNVIDVCEAEEEEIADSSRSPPKVTAVNQSNGGMSEEDNGDVIDGYEVEGMEEREWCLRGVLKFLFTLIAWLLLSSYICPMNSPTDSPTQLAIRDFKDSGVLIKNQSLDFVSMKLHGNGFFEVEDGVDNSIEEVEVEEENYDETDEGIEAEIVEYLEWHEKEMIENENVDSEEDIVDSNIEEVEVEEENDGETDESIDAQIVDYLEWHENDGETDESIDAQIVDYLEWHEQDMVDEAAVFEGVRAAQFEFKADESDEHSIDSKTDENLDDGILLDMEVVSSSYAGLDEDEDNGSNDEAAETEIIVDFEAQSSGQLIGPKTAEREDASGYMLEMEMHSSNQLESQLLLTSISEEIPTEAKGADNTGSLEELSDYMDVGDDDIEDDDAEVGMEKSEWNTVVGVSAVLLVVSASLSIIYDARKSSSSTSSKESQKQKLAVEENVNSVLPSIDRKVEFLARGSLPSHSTREAPRELTSHIRAPTVELIGEIVVGQPSRVRNSGKFQMIVSEDECSAAAFSQKRGSLPRLVPVPSQPSAIEPRPSTSSTSSEIFITERKISKKEGGQSREAMIGTTPVRRSSRLRNRQTVMSP